MRQGRYGGDYAFKGLPDSDVRIEDSNIVKDDCQIVARELVDFDTSGFGSNEQL